MTFPELKNLFHTQLTPLYEPVEIDAFLYRLLQEYTGHTRLSVALQPHLIFSETQRARMQEALEQLKEEKPIQQILGKTYFYGLELYLNEQVLIPRPETEELVDWIVTDVKNDYLPISGIPNKSPSPLHVIDIGTGSGCIAVALAKNLPTARVTAIDHAPAALALTRKNAEKYQVAVTCAEIDIHHIEALTGEFNTVVSNPPYVKMSEKKYLKNNVLKYEPHTALFVPDDAPLLFYEKIALWAKKHLVPGGRLYFEIHREAGDAVTQLLAHYSFAEITLRKDLSGNDRMVRGTAPQKPNPHAKK